MSFDVGETVSIEDEISALVETLINAEARLEALTGGEVDSVSDSRGRIFLFRRAQEQLRQGEAAKQAGILNSLPSSIALLDHDGVVVSINASWRHYAASNSMGSPNAGVGLNYLHVCDVAVGAQSAEARAVSAGIRSVLEGREQDFSLEYPCDSPTEKRWGLLTVSPIGGSRRRGAVVMHLDITERKKAEEELWELSRTTDRRERLLHSALSSMNDFAQIYDHEGRILYVNQPLLDLWGLNLDEAVGKNFIELGYPIELAQRLQEQLRQVFETKQDVTDETPYRSPSGQLGFYEYIFSPILAEDGSVDFVVGSTREISERKRAIKELRESEHRFQSMLENVDLAAKILDLNGDVTFCNEYLLQLLGVSAEEIVGSNWIARFVPEAGQAEKAAALNQMLTKGDPVQMESEVVSKSGVTCQILWNSAAVRDELGRITGVASIGANITERKGLQAQLLQSQKMESIGSLAGGIAHDFNNLLTGMLGFAELAQLRLPPDSPVQQDLQEIQVAAERAARLIKQLVSFARKEVVDPQVVNAGELVDGLSNLIGRLLGARISLRIDTGAEVGHIRLDPSQFEQVLVNLAVNARDAMSEGGTLTIAVSNTVADGLRSGEFPGKHVLLSVTDTGSGMTKRIQDRAFDPFFTTKEKGKGTGLGLSTCHGIVTSGGGHISIASEMNVGTTFNIYFPRVDAPVARHAAQDELVKATRGETILVVDDEDTVRSFSAEILTQLGYRVISAASGLDALALASRPDEIIDLLLSDVEMPGMTGPDLVEVMEHIVPGLKVLYVSGFSSAPQLREWAEAQKAFLQKPFSSAQLSRKVWEVLTTSTSAAG